MKSLEEGLGNAGVASDRTRGQTSYLHVANIILTVAVLISLLFLFFFVRDRTRLKDRILGSELRVRQLEATLSMASEGLSGPPAAQIGDLVPPFEAIDINGQKVKIDYNGSTRYLLFIFSPLCSVCIDEFGKWSDVTKVAEANGYSVFAVSLKTAAVTKDNLPRGSRDFQVLIMPNMAVQRAYRVLAEPVVILVSPQGAVDWVHYGGLNQQATWELTSHLLAKKIT